MAGRKPVTLDLVWSFIALLWKISTVSSQHSAEISDLASCDSNLYFITQPPRALPCDPYPTIKTDTSFLRVECSVITPPLLAANSSIVWSRREEDGTITQLPGNETADSNIVITETSTQNVVNDITNVLTLIRSILEVGGLRLNHTGNTGEYYCQLVTELGNGETSASNASSTLLLFDSMSYNGLDKCDSSSVFLTLGPGCVSTSGNESQATSPPPNEPTICSDCDDTTAPVLSFPLETVIILSSVGGGLALLVCLLLLLLLTTCYCFRKTNTSKSSLRTFKDRAIPLSTSMSNVNIVATATSQSNLINPSTPIDTPFNPFPAPSHPPPVHNTLPTHLKQSVTQTVSNDGSVTSSTELVRKGRAASTIGKLKSACTPTEVDYNSIKRVLATNPDRQELYKSLITGNMDELPVYSTTNASFHGSMESLNSAGAEQPVYTEPTIPLSVSIQSLTSEGDSEEEQPPQYAEPSLPHSVSSCSLHSQREEGASPHSRTRLSLPLNHKLAVFSSVEPRGQPAYSEAEEMSPLARRVNESSQSSPTGRQGKKRPVVPPRPPPRQANKQSSLEKECSRENISLLKRVVQPDLDVHRESVDGEYVCPNGTVERNGHCWELVQLRNHDINPPPHRHYQGKGGSHEYLTLYVDSNK